MEEVIFSPASQRISELKKLRDEKASGIYSGIPLWESFPTLTTIVPTIDKGQVILNFASSGVKLYIAPIKSDKLLETPD